MCPRSPAVTAQPARANADKAAEITKLQAKLKQVRAEIEAMRSVCASAESRVISSADTVDLLHEFTIEILRYIDGPGLPTVTPASTRVQAVEPENDTELHQLDAAGYEGSQP